MPIKQPKTKAALIKFLADENNKFLKITMKTTELTDYGRCEVAKVDEAGITYHTGSPRESFLPFLHVTFLKDGFQVQTKPEGFSTVLCEFLPLDTDVQPIRTRDIYDIMLENANKRRDNQAEFHRVFGAPISRFWIDNQLGFDVIAFESWLKVPESVSMCDHILAVHGEEAMALVQRVL